MASIAHSEDSSPVRSQEGEIVSCDAVLPPIVRTVITQAVRSRECGAISLARFNAQIRRLEQEELSPRGLALLNAGGPKGHAPFLVAVKATGAILGQVNVG